MKKATKEVSFIKLIRILQRCPYSKFFAKPMDYIDEHVTSKEDARRHVIKLLLKSGIRLPQIEEIEERSAQDEKSDEEIIVAKAEI